MSKKIKKRYDDSSAKKQDIGVFVYLYQGGTLLFGESACWRWKTISKNLYLEVDENGETAFHAPASNVCAVGGPQVLFRDAEWKQ